MGLRDTRSKVVSVLLELARDPASNARGEARTELQVTPVDLSTRVGLDVDTAKRAVQRLREQGYARITGEKVEIADLAALRKLDTPLGTKGELRGEGTAFTRAR
jgi:CRP-like cAMP-binding protein